VLVVEESKTLSTCAFSIKAKR